MMIRLNNALRRLRRDDKGVTMVEYGIAVTLAVAVGTFMLTTLGEGINGRLSDAASCMTSDISTDDTGAITGGC